MDLDATQQEALLQLHAITNSSSLDQDRVVLERCGWDVQRAIQTIFDGEDVAAAQVPEPPRASSSRTPPVDTNHSNPIERFEVDDSFQGLNPAGTPIQSSLLSAFYPYLGRIATLFTYPLTITLSLVANLAQFVFRLLRIPFPRISTGSLRFNFFGNTPRIARRPPRSSNPTEAAQRWIMELEDETGAMSIGKATVAAAEGSSVEISDPNGLRRRAATEGKGHLLPNFWLGSYESALKEAQSAPKVLCAIIVSEAHDDTMDFKRNVLTDPDLVRVFTDNDFLVWGGDVRDSDAYQAAQKLGATTYPFVAFIALHPRPAARRTPTAQPQLSVISRHEGPPTTLTSATTLHDHINSTLLPRVRPLLTRLVNEKRNRQQERDLRAEQDRAFREAERLDGIKMEERLKAESLRLEEKRKQDVQRREMEAQAALAKETERTKAEKKDQWRKYQRARMAEEPNATLPGAVRVRIRLPDGRMLSRRFRPEDTVQTLYTYTDIHFLPEGTDNEPPPTALPANHVHSFDFNLATTYPRKEVAKSPDVALGGLSILRGGANLIVEGAPSPTGSDSEDGSDDD